jgi:hypothetical protein
LEQLNGKAATAPVDRCRWGGVHSVRRYELKHYLNGIEYPATKAAIIADVEAQGGPDALIESLQALRRERFSRAIAVEVALHQHQQSQPRAR